MDLEDALSELESQLAATSKEAKAALTALKKAQNGAKFGHIRNLNKALADGRNAAKRFAESMEVVDSSWKFEVEMHMTSGAYLKELQREAEAAELKLFERDGRVYCFPMLLTISANDVAVMINREPEYRIRPRELVRVLAARQRSQQRFNEQKVLDTLFDAYVHVCRRVEPKWNPEGAGTGPVVYLNDIYELLTLLPGSEREYSKEEFTRGIYLLDRKPELRTRDGRRIAWPASSSSRTVRNRLTFVDEQGNEKIYVSIRFDKD